MVKRSHIFKNKIKEHSQPCNFLFLLYIFRINLQSQPCSPAHTQPFQPCFCLIFSESTTYNFNKKNRTEVEWWE